jgi:NAD(P)-dependent dehydrogenase (short-subunit alcohol dehydrogenase family)
VGSKKLYDNNVVGFSEAWFRALDGIGIGRSLSHATGITYADYATNSYCQVSDWEVINHLASTGENLSGTNTVLINCAGFGTTAAHLPSRAHIVSVSDSVIEFRDTSVEIFD